jgi:hypothetical protein
MFEIVLGRGSVAPTKLRRGSVATEVLRKHGPRGFEHDAFVWAGFDLWTTRGRTAGSAPRHLPYEDPYSCVGSSAVCTCQGEVFLALGM